jgi:outer membrane protein TolC
MEVRLIAAALLFVSAAFSNSHVEAQNALSMKDAVALALANRPEMRASAQRILASQRLEAQAKLIPNPRLYFQSEDLHASDFSFSKDAETYAYASEVIETSGRRKARIEVALQDARLNTVRADQTKAQISVGVRRAYWAACRASLLAQLYGKDADYFGQIIAYNEDRFREGKIAEVDLLRVKLEGERVRAVAAGMQLAVGRTMLNLTTAMGSPTGKCTLSEPFEELESPRSIPSDRAPVLLRAEDEQAQSAIEVARANVSFQKSIGRPDIEVLAGYNKNLGPDTAMAGVTRHSNR